MFIIRKATQKKYLAVIEDEGSVRLNLTSDIEACTVFETEEEARELRDEVVTSAKEQANALAADNPDFKLEQESLQDYFTLTIVKK